MPGRLLDDLFVQQQPPGLLERPNQVPKLKGGFPKIRGTILGVSIVRTIVILGSTLGGPYFGKLPRVSGLYLRDHRRLHWP